MQQKNRHFFKSITQDFALNIIASLLSTGIMQLVVYPRLAATLSSNEYGIMLTITGYINVIILAFGNNLCNARLIQETRYTKNNLVGDFQLLLVMMSVFTLVSTAICCIFVGIGFWICLELCLMAVVSVVKSYYLVIYRITIDYKKNLLANVAVGLGYVIGSFLLVRIVDWPWIFSLGCLMGILYIACSTPIMQEPFKRTVLFKDSFKAVMVLAIGGLLGNATTYLDRFIIYPVLGGEAVSIYATAAFFSKSLNLVLAPITSVLLSYLTTNKLILNKKRYIMLNLGMVCIGLVFFTICITLGKYITALLYPSLISEALPFIPIVSCGIVIGVVGTFSNIVVLAKSSIHWQTVLPIIKFALYFALGVILIKKYGLIGLCVSVTITNLIVLFVTFIIGLFTTSNERKSEL